MSEKRVCKLANHENNDVDLRDYEDIIIKTIEETVPGKNPVVKADRFVTDALTHSEAVKLGRAMSRVSELSKLGKEVTQYWLFEGRTVKYGEPNDKTTKDQPKGERKNGTKSSAKIPEHR